MRYVIGLLWYAEVIEIRTLFLLHSRLLTVAHYFIPKRGHGIITLMIPAIPAGDPMPFINYIDLSSRTPPNFYQHLKRFLLRSPARAMAIPAAPDAQAEAPLSELRSLRFAEL